MPKKTLKCSRCSRTFSMAPHLARHMQAIHHRSRGTAGSKRAAVGKVTPKQRKRNPVNGRRRKAGRRATAWSHAGVVSRLVSEMQSYLGELHQQRATIDAEANAITLALQTMRASTTAAARVPGRPGRPPGRSAGRTGSLKNYILRVLRQRSGPMSPRDIATAVVQSGYKSKARDLTKAVSNTLPGLKSVKKVGFAKYKL